MDYIVKCLFVGPSTHVGGNKKQSQDLAGRVVIREISPLCDITEVSSLVHTLS